MLKTEFNALLLAAGFVKKGDDRWYGHNLIATGHPSKDGPTMIYVGPDYNKYPSPPEEKRKVRIVEVEKLQEALDFFGVKSLKDRVLEALRSNEVKGKMHSLTQIQIWVGLEVPIGEIERALGELFAEYLASCASFDKGPTMRWCAVPKDWLESTYGRAFTNPNYTAVVDAYKGKPTDLSYDEKITFIAYTQNLEVEEVKSILDVHRGLI